MEPIDSTISALDKITIVFTTITMIIVLWNWFKNRKSNDKIVIELIIKVTDEELEQFTIQKSETK